MAIPLVNKHIGAIYKGFIEIEALPNYIKIISFGYEANFSALSSSLMK